MTRERFEQELDAWLGDLRRQVLQEFDSGTDAPLCLYVGQERVYWRWIQQARMTIDSVIPPRLFQRN